MFWHDPEINQTLLSEINHMVFERCIRDFLNSNMRSMNCSNKSDEWYLHYINDVLLPHMKSIQPEIIDKNMIDEQFLNSGYASVEIDLMCVLICWLYKHALSIGSIYQKE